jgi:hypothetical protein
MKRRSITGVIVSAIIASYVALSVVGFFQPVRVALMHLALPPLMTVESSLQMIRGSWDILGLGSRTTVQELTNQSAMYEENLRAAEARISELEALNATFIEGVVGEGDLPARVLMRTMDGTENTIIVDRGETDGVRSGARVRTPAGLIGEVGEVMAHRSTVRLYSSPGYVSQSVLQEAEVDLQIQGLGLGLYSAKVPSDLEPKVGMLVVNNASEKLVLGVITSVEQNPASSFADVRIESPTNVQTVQRLFVQVAEK